MLLVLPLVCDCSVPHAHPLPQPQPIIETPVPLPDTINKKVELDFSPEQTEYYVRTRIVIEIVAADISEEYVFIAHALSTEVIKKEIEIVENVYGEVGLKLYIDQITFVEHDANWAKYRLDAMNFPDYLSVYYLLPGSFPFQGLSCYPDDAEGIVLSPERDSYTLAHEIGHFFGLKHIFGEDDFVDDTPFQESKKSAPDSSNYYNVMGYDGGEPSVLTHGQAQRVLYFIHNHRWNCIMHEKPPTSFMLQVVLAAMQETVLNKPREVKTLEQIEQELKADPFPGESLYNLP
jgi:hypothetical protein